MFVTVMLFLILMVFLKLKCINNEIDEKAKLAKKYFLRSLISIYVYVYKYKKR